MPQYIIIGIAVLSLLKDSFKGIKKEWLYGIGIAVFLYVLYRRYLKSLADSSKNDGSDLNGLCSEIKNAINPTWDWFKLFDGTDEEAIKNVGRKLKESGGTIKELSEKWNEIEKTNLYDELTAEGVYNIFVDAYNSASKNSDSGSSGSGSSTIVKSNLKKGDIVYTKSEYKLRNTNPPYSMVKLSSAGIQFVCHGNPYIATIEKTKTEWIVIKQSSWLGDTYYVIATKALYKK